MMMMMIMVEDKQNIHNYYVRGQQIPLGLND